MYNLKFISVSVELPEMCAAELVPSFSSFLFLANNLQFKHAGSSVTSLFSLQTCLVKRVWLPHSRYRVTLLSTESHIDYIHTWLCKDFYLKADFKKYRRHLREKFVTLLFLWSAQSKCILFGDIYNICTFKTPLVCSDVRMVATCGT